MIEQVFSWCLGPYITQVDNRLFTSYRVHNVLQRRGFRVQCSDFRAAGGEKDEVLAVSSFAFLPPFPEPLNTERSDRPVGWRIASH